ncbi:GIN domain-containing protein [Formosa sp. PL04]|uniref:GIN domain-containing protein n=1 Tax=Formosa sp. PL04 TaxID=3081755 RepID=UPI0029821A12|nr:DUF2807 domain-containing protein [Formosa sp. PL04]MDW5289343.1 DUF2807 domain-containing protein [Formosa sp. PL04]
MKKIVSALNLILLVLLVSCNTSDDGSSTIIDLPYFDSLNVQDNITLILISGPNQVVELYGDGDLNTVDLFVDNGELIMSAVSSEASNVVVYVAHPDINNILVQNNGIVQFDNYFTTTASELYITGLDAAQIFNEYEMNVNTLDVLLENAAKMALLNLQSEELYVHLSDGSRCNIQGFATNQFIDLNNGCRFNLDFPIQGWDITSPIQSTNCTITTDNGGNGWVQATNTLTATASNGSRVFYQGVPNVLNAVEINGGRVEQMDF